MAPRIVILKRADRKIKQIYIYLLENWNQKVADDFYKRVESITNLIATYPYIGQSSAKKQHIRRKLITKHNCLYYTFKNDSIIILDVIDTRRNPVKNPYE